jgi:hypothetical protein
MPPRSLVPAPGRKVQRRRRDGGEGRWNRTARKAAGDEPVWVRIPEQKRRWAYGAALTLRRFVCLRQPRKPWTARPIICPKPREEREAPPLSGSCVARRLELDHAYAQKKSRCDEPLARRLTLTDVRYVDGAQPRRRDER